MFYLTDGNSSIEIKKFGIDLESAGEYTEVIKDGAVLAIKGSARFEMKKDKRDDDLTFHFDSIAEIIKIERSDKAEKKRIELHLHTQMSAMDAVIPPDVAVKTAKKWGHHAIAITDHGNVQGFPEAMLAADKTVKGVSVEGCKYPLKKARLERSRGWTVSNEITGNCALVEVRRGALYVMESK